MLFPAWEVCVVESYEREHEYALPRGRRLRADFLVRGHSFSVYSLNGKYCNL